MMSESCLTLAPRKPAAATVDAAIKTWRSSASMPAMRPIRAARPGAGDASGRRDDGAARERAIQSLSLMGMGRERAMKFVDLTEKLCALGDGQESRADLARMVQVYFPYSQFCP